MKKILMILLAFALVFGLVLTGCTLEQKNTEDTDGDCDCEDDDDDDDDQTPLDLLKAAEGGLTIGVAGSTAPEFDAETKVVTVTGSDSSMFYITQDFSSASNKSIKITYGCVVETGEAKVIVKQGSNSWTDLGGGAGNSDKYLTLEEGLNKVLTVNGNHLNTNTNGISFQHNVDGNSGAKYYVKIFSVVVE
jgi:hypothetical protein